VSYETGKPATMQLKSEDDMSFWERIKAFFVKAGSVLKNVLKTIFVVFSKEIIDELLDFAISICGELDGKDLSSSDKRKEAFKAIKDEATVRGMNLRDSLINLLIELAVNYIRSLQADGK